MADQDVQSGIQEFVNGGSQPAPAPSTTGPDPDTQKGITEFVTSGQTPATPVPPPPTDAQNVGTALSQFHDASRAGAEHAIRSSAPFQWLYNNLPALKQGDQQAGYTPLTEEQYQSQYGNSTAAKVGGAVMGGLVAAPAAVAAEAVGGPLAASLGAGRLIAGAPTVLRAATTRAAPLMSSPAVSSMIGPIRDIGPILGGAVRLGTNAVQGMAGAAATGGNLLTGAIGGAALPVAGKLLGDLGNSGAVQYLTNNKLVRAAVALGGSALGYEHGHSLWEALGGLGLGGGVQHYLGDVVPGLVNPLLRGIGAASPYMAVPGGEAGGQVPVPGL